MDVEFKQVDVFTKVPFLGNPVAVVLDAQSLTAAQMQRIANWTNLSETTFVLPASDARADYHVRIFTPNAELPFAGHPTVGTAYALLEAGRVQARHGRLVQQCGAGLVALDVSHDDSGSRSIAFKLPEPKVRELTADETELTASALGVALTPKAQTTLIDVGPRWIVARLDSAEAVLALKPDFERMAAQNARDGSTGVVVYGPHSAPENAAIEIRAFAPAHGINEDPVCGSGTGCVGVHLLRTGRVSPPILNASQGRMVGRAGVLRVDLSNGVRVGGNAVTCITGRIVVPGQ